MNIFQIDKKIFQSFLTYFIKTFFGKQIQLPNTLKKTQILFGFWNKYFPPIYHIFLVKSQIVQILLLSFKVFALEPYQDNGYDDCFRQFAKDEAFMHEEVVSSTTTYIFLCSETMHMQGMHHVYVLTSSGRIISIETYPS